MSDEVIHTVSGREFPISTNSAKRLTEGTIPEHALCKVCAGESHKVRQVTLGNHVKEISWPLVWDEGFYFCESSDCPKEDIKTRVGIKETEAPVPVCYCMNVLEETILKEIVVKRCCDSLEDIKEYTKARTGKLCHITNPSGKCCGGHVAAVIEKGLTQVVDRRLAREAWTICCEIPEE
jgi:hypothetical protein